MERGEELMQLNRAAFDRNTQAFERMMATFDSHEQRMMATFDSHERLFDRHEQLFEQNQGMFEEYRIFIREMNRRGERVVQDLVRRNEEFNVEQSRRTDAIVRHLDDLTEESKAQRQAMLALFDRLPPSQAA